MALGIALSGQCVLARAAFRPTVIAWFTRLARFTAFTLLVAAVRRRVRPFLLAALRPRWALHALAAFTALAPTTAASLPRSCRALRTLFTTHVVWCRCCTFARTRSRIRLGPLALSRRRALAALTTVAAPTTATTATAFCATITAAFGTTIGAWAITPFRATYIGCCGVPGIATRCLSGTGRRCNSRRRCGGPEQVLDPAKKSLFCRCGRHNRCCHADHRRHDNRR